MRKITYDEMAACAKREVRYRRRVYRRLIAEDALDVDVAEREIAVMEAIADYFEKKSQPELL